MCADIRRLEWNEWHGRGRGSAKERSPEADAVGSRGHLHAKFTWVVSIIVNFPSEVIARKRPWRAESHFSQERGRRVCGVHTRVRYLTPCLSARETRPARL